MGAKNTELILRETIHGLGDLGDLVRVRAGYARNCLLPKGLALRATAGSKAQLDHERRLIEAKIKKLLVNAEAVAKTLKSAVVEVSKKAGKEGRLFGSVTSMDIEGGLHRLGYGVHRKQVMLEQPIKMLGEHTVKIKLHPHVVVPVTIKVLAEADREHEHEETAATPVADEPSESENPMEAGGAES